MPKLLKIVTALICVVMGIASIGLIWVRDSSNNPEYCGLCHNGDVDGRFASWESSDYLASAHSQAAVSCQNCHPRTLAESVNEIIVFVTGDYDEPLAAMDHSDEECFSCHGSEEQIFQRTASLSLNPHYLHLIGEVECTTCHNMHEPSEDYCAQCHNAVATGPGWAAEVPDISEVGLQVFDPDMDCTVCHVMVPYFESLTDPDLDVYAHVNEGADCIECHGGLEAVTQVHEEAVSTAFIRPRTVDMEYCFDCHLENEHTSYEQVAARTTDYMVLGENINPHAQTLDPSNSQSPHESGEGQIQCSSCHRMHKPSMGMDFCFNCHHEENFESCYGAGCHETADW